MISFKKKVLVFFFLFLTSFSLQVREHLGSLLVYLIDVDHVRKSWAKSKLCRYIAVIFFLLVAHVFSLNSIRRFCQDFQPQWKIHRSTCQRTTVLSCRHLFFFFQILANQLILLFKIETSLCLNWAYIILKEPGEPGWRGLCGPASVQSPCLETTRSGDVLRD